MNRKARCFQPLAAELESRNLLSVMAAPAPETDGAEVRILTDQGSTTPTPTETDQSSTTSEDNVQVMALSDRSGATPAVAITNTVSGRYFAAEDNRAADAPLHVQLKGNGRVNGIGVAKLKGSLDLGGFRIAGSKDVSGTLTLTNARGSVKIRLSGSGGFNEVPNGQFVTDVTVVKGSGAFRGFQRNGTVTFDFGANQVRSLVAPSPIGGTMTVTLSLKPLVK